MPEALRFSERHETTPGTFFSPPGLVSYQAANDEVSELYTAAASRGDVNTMRALREEYADEISAHACLAVFLYAVDQEHISMLRELAHAPIGAVFSDPCYRAIIRRQICLNGNRELIEAVCSLPGMNLP